MEKRKKSIVVPNIKGQDGWFQHDDPGAKFGQYIGKSVKQFEGLLH